MRWGKSDSDIEGFFYAPHCLHGRDAHATRKALQNRLMTFNSWEFLLFFPIVTSLYFALPHRWRWLLLLVASCIFYMAFIPAYVLILLFTIAVDYAAGILIERSTGPRRGAWLICSLVANIGVLAVFKYGNFASDNLAHIARLLDLHYPAKVVQIILPIGLSFHTFQAMSYTIEVYRGHQAAERHLGIYALYVMFYPQLVAGPIERPQNLLHQFHEPHNFDGSRVADGLGRMLWGMFKKIVIADRLAIIVNTVYAKPRRFSGIVLLLATYCFAIQIYSRFLRLLRHRHRRRPGHGHSRSWKTSTAPTSAPPWPNSGDAGTSPSPAGSATISTFHWAATASPGRDGASIS